MTIHNYVLEWERITMDIRHDDAFYSDGEDFNVQHIEVQSWERQKLPITETGYRSHFMTAAKGENPISPYGTAKEYVQAWLDYKADSKIWRKYIQDRRQLRLF